MEKCKEKNSQSKNSTIGMKQERIFLVLFLLIIGMFLSHSKKIIKTVAGLPPFSGDGTLAVDAIFDRISGVFGTASNDIFISDTFNHVIRKVDKNGIITLCWCTWSKGE